MRNRRVSIALTLVMMLAILVTPVGAAQGAANGMADGAYLQGVMDFIKSQYNFDINDQALTEGATKGMFDRLDAYSQFFTSQEADEFLEDIEGNFEGIGVVISTVDNYVVVSRVFPSSPAETAGVFAGDKIVLIDEKNVVGLSSDEVSSRLRGNSGLIVKLGVLRNGIKEIKMITVKRELIKINPVHYEIKGNIGYISIDSFNSNTHEYLSEALKRMDEKQIKKIILDLRNNTGGEVEQAVLVARRFVPEGVITNLIFKNKENQDVTYRSYLKEPAYKLVVLVNEMTASSSEILAGAIQDSGAGTLVGTKTYGKARVQNVVPLLTPQASQKYKAQCEGKLLINANELIQQYQIFPEKSEIAGWADITTGIYTTPKGRFIDGKGLSPDVAVANHEVIRDVFINNVVKLSKTQKLTQGSEGIDVYNAEKILRVAGYPVDLPDMKLDAKTFAAIQTFQQNQGLSPYGVLDFTTQEALNQKLEQLLLQIDKQYARAVEMLK